MQVGQDHNVQIRVRNVLKDALVECETAVGPVTARWRGEDAPVVGATHEVELDTCGRLVWAEGLSIVSPDGPSHGVQTLSGLIEDIEGDSVVVRVGEGVLLLDVAGDPPLGAVGEVVSLRPAAFEVWPTGI